MAFQNWQRGLRTVYNSNTVSKCDELESLSNILNFFCISFHLTILYLVCTVYCIFILYMYTYSIYSICIQYTVYTEFIFYIVNLYCIC